MVQTMQFHSVMRSNENQPLHPFAEYEVNNGPYAEQIDLNANNGLTIIWLVERSINEITHFLQRMIYLAKKAAQHDCSGPERSLLEREYTILLNEIDHYAQTTCFNRIRLTSGEVEVITIKLGSHYINSPHMNISLCNLSALGLDLTGTRLDTAEEAAETVIKLENARMTSHRAKTQLTLDKSTIETSLSD